MRHWESLPVVLRLLIVLLALALVLTGCGLGEPMTPNPPTGIPADRSVGVVAPVPAPIPHSLEQRQECFTCHDSGAVDAPPVPADHERDVTLCTTCHAVWLAPDIAAAAPPAIPHELEGREECLVCHKLGTADAPRVPDNHDGLTSDICQTCHTRRTEIGGGSEGEEQGPAAEAPPIPHGLEGFSACTGCHAEGGPGIPQFPEDHEGRTDDICSACHQPASAVAVTTSTPEPTETPSEATSTPEATGTAREPTSTSEATETPSEPTSTAKATGTPSEATSTPEAAASPTEAATSTAGDATAGEVLFGTRCAPCHGAEGEGTTIVPDALNDASLLAQLTDEDLMTTIREGIDNKMPPSPNLSDEEILDIIAFLRSWQ